MPASADAIINRAGDGTASAEAVDPLRHHRGHADKHGAFGTDSFGRKAEAFARFFGTPVFLVGQTLFVAGWIAFNGLALGVFHWDPYPFILLNLLFSTQAAYAAPMILLAQTRQADRDKAAEAANAAHREEVAGSQMRLLSQNTDLTQEIHAMQKEQMDFFVEMRQRP